MGKEPPRNYELLPGTLDMLILRTLQRGAMHGYGIAQHLRMVSDEILQVGEARSTPRCSGCW